MMGSAFAPAHITGFFSVLPNSEPLRAGSLGCGLCLEDGIRAEIDINSSVSAITLNGEHTDFPTVEYVLTELVGTDRPPFSINLISDIRPAFWQAISQGTIPTRMSNWFKP